MSQTSDIIRDLRKEGVGFCLTPFEGPAAIMVIGNRSVLDSLNQVLEDFLASHHAEVFNLLRKEEDAVSDFTGLLARMEVLKSSIPISYEERSRQILAQCIEQTDRLIRDFQFYSVKSVWARSLEDLRVLTRNRQAKVGS